MPLFLLVHVGQAVALAGLALWQARKGYRVLVIVNVVAAVASMGIVFMDVRTLLLDNKIEMLKGDVDHYGMIHKPKTGCPPGFEEVPETFRRDKAFSAGCKNLRKPDGPIDYLMPGESARLDFLLRLPLPENGPRI